MDDGLFTGLTPIDKLSIKLLPPTPTTLWECPKEFPRLSSAHTLSFDVETYDPELLVEGPGWARDKGHIVGVSVGALGHDGKLSSWYFPMRHEVEPEYNMNPTNVVRWLKDTLGTNQPKIGANLTYDVGWLGEEDIRVNGLLYDVQYAEALLDADAKVSLELLSQKYLGTGKESSLLYEWCAQAYGGKANGKQRANIYRTSPKLSGYYAESDAYLPIQILKKQVKIIRERGLMPLFKMECGLIPLVIAMRRQGVTVDLDGAEKLRDRLIKEFDTKHKLLCESLGFECNIMSRDDLKKAFDLNHIDYPVTEKGNASFVKSFLDSLDDPIGKQIVELRELEKIRTTFVEGAILNKNVNGKIYCQFHPLKGDENGARTGRWASSTPNLQNIPARTALGKEMRSLFIPDKGHLCWEKDDYSQIEYRMLVHFAVGTGADGVREQYNKDPSTDYHVHTQELVKQMANLFIDRKPIKNINFGLLYGMGEPKLARQIGITKSKASEIFGAYHKGAPYVKATMDYFSSMAEKQGYVPTIMGRRAYFNYYEPRNRKLQTGLGYPIEQALRLFGTDIMRQGTYKAVNCVLQGSSADMLKAGMLECYRQGIFDITGIPRLTVHDELDFSVEDDSQATQEGFTEMRRIMEKVIPLRIPVKLDSDRGANWGVVG